MLRSFTSSAASRLRTTRLATGTTTATTRAFSRTTVASHARVRTTTNPAFTSLGFASRSLAARPLTIRRALATITDIKAPISTYPKTNPEFATNPILNWHTFPNFAAIKAEHVVPAIEVLTKQIEATFQERSKRMTPTWEGTMGLSKYQSFPIVHCYYSCSVAANHTYIKW